MVRWGLRYEGPDFGAASKAARDFARKADTQVAVAIGKMIMEAMRVRIEGRGVDEMGRPFPAYSTQWPAKIGLMLPAGGDRRWGPVRGGTRRGKNWVRFESVSDFRRQQGLPTDRLRFSLTGRMWRALRSLVRWRGDAMTIDISLRGAPQEANAHDFWAQVKTRKALRRAGQASATFVRGFKTSKGESKIRTETVSAAGPMGVANERAKGAFQFAENARRKSLDPSRRSWLCPSREELAAARTRYFGQFSRFVTAAAAKNSVEKKIA